MVEIREHMENCSRCSNQKAERVEDLKRRLLSYSQYTKKNGDVTKDDILHAIVEEWLSSMSAAGRQTLTVILLQIDARARHMSSGHRGKARRNGKAGSSRKHSPHVAA